MVRYMWTVISTLKGITLLCPCFVLPTFWQNIYSTNRRFWCRFRRSALSIRQPGERVIAYASRTLSPRERRYSATEKEAFAVVFGVRHFRVYLLGRKFEMITDHSALCLLHTMDPTGRLARWIMDLQEVQFEIKHKKGRLHSNADALSRLRLSNDYITRNLSR